MLTAVFYTLTTVMLAGLLVTYSMVYRATRDKIVLANIVFYFAVLCIAFAAAYIYWVRTLTGQIHLAPLPEFRSSILFLSTSFLFYHTWKQNGSLTKGL